MPFVKDILLMQVTFLIFMFCFTYLNMTYIFIPSVYYSMTARNADVTPVISF